MNEDMNNLLEQIQEMAAKLVAGSPPGRNLALAGGFRYRFLDHSVRISRDIDYHWSGDLAVKQNELLGLFQRRLLPEIKRRLNLNGSAQPGTGMDAELPFVRTVNLAFWEENVPYSRIEVPVEITRVICLDPPITRTVGGAVYLALSDADMIESKILAVFNRHVLEHRDLVDIFLFSNTLLPKSSQRVAHKCSELGISRQKIEERIVDLHKRGDYHARSIQAVIDSQLDSVPASNIGASGGALKLLRSVIAIIEANTAENNGVTE